MQEIVTNLLTPFLISLIVALGIGLIVGMEREFDTVSGKEHFAGLRAFAFMSVLGCMTAFLSVQYNENIILVVTPTVIVYISVFHYSKMRKENFGIVTELSLILVFFLGVISGLHFIKEALAVSVVATILLTLKKKFRETIKLITQEELYAFVKFIVLSFLILPFLPDINYGPNDIINPRKIGFIVVTISALSFIGYFIMKFFGAKRGIDFAAFFGGAVSSTAVAWVLSKRSKENEGLSRQYASGIIIACGVMLFRVLIISGLFNMAVFKLLLIPCGLVMISTVIVYAFNRKTVATVKEKAIQMGNPLSINSALLFGALYVAMTFFLYFANFYLGTKGLVITGIISGMTDMDAINISISKMGLNEIRPDLAASIILLAMSSNTVLKMFVAYFRGSKELSKLVFGGLLPTVIITIVSAITMHLIANKL